MSLPLAGLTVLDLSRLFPGPYATMVLADLGARVIKIESPSAPDLLRFPPPHLEGNNVGFATLNRNKQSVLVELTTPEGSEIVRKLAQRADLFLTSTRPGWLDRFGLGYRQLKEEAPGLIYATLRGYASDRPEGQQGGHDLNFLALSGLADLLRDPTGAPVVPKVQLGDIAGSLSCVIALLCALIRRGSDGGRGAELEISITESCRAFTVLLEALVHNGQQRGPLVTGPLSGRSPVYRYYRCRDDRYIALAAIEMKFQRILRQALELDQQGWPTDLFFEWEKTEIVHRHLEELFVSQDRDHWCRLLGQFDVCFTPVLSLEEAAERFDCRYQVDTEEGGQAVQPGPLLGRNYPLPEPGRAAASAGHDTIAVLEELRYSPQQIEGFIEAGAIPEASV